MPPLLKSHLENNQLAHGYLLVGALEKARGVVLEIARSLLPGFKKENSVSHPDFYEVVDRTVGIDDAREIIKRANLKPFQEDSKVFFVDAEDMSSATSNALLKIMEEPALGNYFFLRSSSSEKILKTLLSRLTKVRLGFSENLELKNLFLDFQKKSYSEKMKYIKKISEDKDRNARESFLSAYEIYFENLIKEKEGENLNIIIKKLEDLIFARNLIASPASYPKQVLEFLAVASL